MATHECRQERRIEDLDAAYVRHQRELYEGNGSKPPITVRLDRCERIVNALTYVSTAILISILVGAGTVIWQTVIRTQSPAHQYEPSPKN